MAALSVLAYHVWLYRFDRPFGKRTELFDHFMFNLHLGLICFFVLSGFLLWRSFSAAALSGSGTVGTVSYARRRVARIVPAYWASILGCFILYPLTGVDSPPADLGRFLPGLPPLSELPVFLLFLQNYSVETMMAINPVYWTLCIEVTFYIVLPLIGLLAIALGRGHAGRQAGLLVALIGIGVAWNLAHPSAKLDEVARKSLPAYIACFAAGMLVALWLERRRRDGDRPLSSSASSLLFAAGAVIVVAGGTWKEAPSLLLDLRAPLINFVPAVGFALIVAAVAAGKGAAVRAVGVRPLVWAGVISYGLYLWHVPVIAVMWKLGWLPVALAPRMLVVLAVSAGFGAASWFLIERPAIAWGSRRRRTLREPELSRAG